MKAILVTWLFDMAARLPLRALHAVGSLLGRLMYALDRKYAGRLHANLAHEYRDRPDAEFRRVLRVGGLLTFTTFGPDTLQELRSAFAGVDGGTHTNRFVDMHDIGDALVREIADAMVSSGMRDAGYVYVNIDDGWQGRGQGQGSNRDWFITCEKDFPHGMKWLADRIRSLGLKPGIWLAPYTISEPTDVFRSHPDWLLRIDKVSDFDRARSARKIGVNRTSSIYSIRTNMNRPGAHLVFSDREKGDQPECVIANEGQLIQGRLGNA